MDYLALGSTGLTVSRIGFGCRPLSGAFGPVDEATARATVLRALDLGITLFEVAPDEGQGRVEELLGRVLPRDPGATTVALPLDARLLEEGADAVGHAVAASLRRLRREAVDLLVLQPPSLEAPETSAALAPLEPLLAQGTVRSLAATVVEGLEGLAAIASGRIGVLQFPYNVLTPVPGQMLFAVAPQRGVGLIACQALSGGLLTGAYGPDAFFPDSDIRSHLPRDIIEIRTRVPHHLGFLRSEWRRTMAQAFIRYVLDTPPIHAVLVGCRTPEQVEEDVGALAVPRLTPSDHQRIHEALYQMAHRRF